MTQPSFLKKHPEIKDHHYTKFIHIVTKLLTLN